MKLTILIENINYSDVAVKVMPLLGQKGENYPGAVEKIMDAISKLPENLIRDIFAAIPTKQKNEIIAAFAVEQKDTILQVINALSRDHRIGVTLADCSIDSELSIVAEVTQIDYLSIVDRFLPIVRKKLITMGGIVAIVLWPMIQNASADQIVGLLDRLVGNKDAFVSSLINQHQKVLINVIEDAAGKQNIHLTIHSVLAEA